MSQTTQLRRSVWEQSPPTRTGRGAAVSAGGSAAEHGWTAWAGGHTSPRPPHQGRRGSPLRGAVSAPAHLHSPSPPSLAAPENFGSWGPAAPSQPAGEGWTRSSHGDGVCALAEGPSQRSPGRGRGCGYPRHPQKQSRQAGHPW